MHLFSGETFLLSEKSIFFLAKSFREIWNFFRRSRFIFRKNRPPDFPANFFLKKITFLEKSPFFLAISNFLITQIKRFVTIVAKTQKSSTKTFFSAEITFKKLSKRWKNINILLKVKLQVCFCNSWTFQTNCKKKFWSQNKVNRGLFLKKQQKRFRKFLLIY